MDCRAYSAHSARPAGTRHSERSEESALFLTRRQMKQILRYAQDDVLVVLVEKFAYIANGATDARPAIEGPPHPAAMRGPALSPRERVYAV